MEFLERIKLELEDLQEELKGLPPLKSGCRVGDFGCGKGYVTLCLMLMLQANESIGIDRFTGDAWTSSYQNVQNFWDDVKRSLLNDSPQEDSLQWDLRQLFSQSRFPTFQQGDVLQGHNLPSDLEFAYCKKLLGNIYSGEYENIPNGEKGLNQMLANIAAALKQGGIFCAVEKATVNYTPFIEQAGLTFLRICQIRRSEIGLEGRLTSSMRIEDCIVYLYQKP